ncbi:Hypothetical predicted protein [Octopus vulgaris]|uniref:Uncharacterized protein n=1 Tax=Octopus vulgaris TaxID=6645 RepID=A0AA36AEZ5_OCTVU|nr:Hypothetical predicted protein [Octopus vulgaris]
MKDTTKKELGNIFPKWCSTHFIACLVEEEKANDVTEITIKRIWWLFQKHYDTDMIYSFFLFHLHVANDNLTLTKWNIKKIHSLLLKKRNEVVLKQHK